MRHLLASFFLAVAFAAAGCSTQEQTAPPRGVSLVESQGQATIQISSEVWSKDSCSVRMHRRCWVVDFFPPAPPEGVTATGDEEPQVRLRLRPYQRLVLRFVDGKGAVVRSEDLRRPPEEEAVDDEN